jgi:DNA ligase-4
LVVKVFDILMLNGVCLADKPLSERRRVLFDTKGTGFRVFEPVPGRLELADQWEGKTDKDIRDRLEWIMENK